MDQMGDFFLMIGGYLGTGTIMLIAGAVLLVMARKAQEQNRKVMKWIGIPLLGCGGCLVVVPTVILLALFGLGLSML